MPYPLTHDCFLPLYPRLKASTSCGMSRCSLPLFPLCVGPTMSVLLAVDSDSRALFLFLSLASPPSPASSEDNVLSSLASHRAGGEARLRPPVHAAESSPGARSGRNSMNRVVPRPPLPSPFYPLEISLSFHDHLLYFTHTLNRIA